MDLRDFESVKTRGWESLAFRACRRTDLHVFWGREDT